MAQQKQLRALLIRGLENLNNEIELVGRLLTDRSTHPEKTLEQAQQITHQIKGTSGSIGYLMLSEAAAALDEQLKHLAGDGVAPEDLKVSDALFEDLKRVASETTCETSTLYNIDLTTLARRQS